MTYPPKVRQLATDLRQQGYSINEISKRLDLAASTVSIWVRNTHIPPTATSRLKQRRIIGRKKSLQTLRKKQHQEMLAIHKFTSNIISNTPKNKSSYALIAALLYWTEGSKQSNKPVRFSNSDPKMVKLFIDSLSNSFDFSWNKLKAKLHLHDYHNPTTQTLFWSKFTGIPTNRFLKPYIKLHTSVRQKENYPGCLSLYYYDNHLNRQLTSLYQKIADHF